MVIKKKSLIIVIVVFAFVGLFSACMSNKPELEKSPAQNYSLPEQRVFQNYIKEQLKNTLDSGALVLNTSLADPVEIEVREYRLDNNGKPIVDLIAWVREMTIGQQGNEIASAIVNSTLNWIIGQGFDPRKERIIPICTIQHQQVSSDQAIRVFGRSNYDPSTDSIVWHLAFN